MQDGSDTSHKQCFRVAPERAALLMALVIFAVHVLITMGLNAMFPGLKPLQAALIDAAGLTLVLLPVFWFYIVTPLKKEAIREKTRNEQLRRQSATDWEETFNTITDMVTIHDNDFTIVQANRAARERLNLSELDRSMSKCFRHYHGAASPPESCPSCQVMNTGVPITIESYEPYLNMYVETRAIPRLDKKNRVMGLIHVVRDITERKRMEAELERQKRLAESLIQNSAVATFVLDPAHTIVLWNKACEELSGIPASIMIGTDDQWKAFYDRKRPTLADAVIDGAYESLSALYGNYSRSSLISSGFHAEGWFLNLNGKNRYMLFDAAPVFDAEGKLLVVIETLQDIPDRKRIEEDLARSESKLRTLIEAEMDCVNLLAGDGTVLEMNPAGLRMIEADGIEHVAGKSFYQFAQPEYSARLRAMIERVFGGEAGSKVEFEFTGLKGTRGWGEMHAVPLRNASDRIQALLAVTRDITEQKKLENQLRHAQKMEAVGTLTGGIAHDFNNILTSIIGYSDLVQMTFSGAEHGEIREYMDQVLAAAKRGATLTQNLLAFSRKTIMTLRPVDLNMSIRNLEKMLRRLIGEEIDLHISLADGELVVLADTGQMEQVLMNLAVNARDAMSGRGKLSITTDLREMNQEFIRDHGYGREGMYGVIRISDTGSGINEKTKRRIFEPFFTTKELGKGTGLGLSIVYGIVKQHDGYIDCESAPGKGATFSLYLPLKRAVTEEANSKSVDRVQGGTEWVLVTEDDPEVRRLTKAMLERLGYSILTAGDGEEAVTMFKANQDRIRLLILDVIMPKKNGKEAYDEIRKLSPDVKCLFMSGYTADVISGKGVLDGDIHFLSKPVSIRDLSKKMREILDGTATPASS